MTGSAPSDRTWEEYTLLQDKLDKIGDFRFRIKSWAMTLITGFVVGGFASKIPSFLYLIGLPIIGIFHLFDLNQSIWHAAFRRRLSQLESRLRKETKSSDGSKYFSRLKSSPAIVFSVAEALEKSRSKWSNRWFVIPIHNLFYYVLYIVVLGTFAYSFFALEDGKPPVQNIFKSMTIEHSSDQN